MKHTGKCPKCASTDILTDALALNRGDGSDWRELCVGRDEHPDALVFKGRRTTTVSAWICTACGYTEFYADQPLDLLFNGEAGADKGRVPFKNPFDPA